MSDAIRTLTAAMRKVVNYRMIWRWHFYAGLVCIPFIVVLSITGPIYLFKPQIEAAIDAPYDHLPFDGAPHSVAAMVEAARAANPGAVFRGVEVRPDTHDAARVILLDKGEKLRVYVHPKTLAVLKQVPEEKRFMAQVKTIHGELLSGRVGEVIVELAACWAIVMIISGLYLWWPREAKGLRGLLWPRLDSGRRIFWRDLHAVTGVYISVFALFLLLTGLPWTYVWGSAFKALKGPDRPGVSQGWSLGRHEEHHMMMAQGGAAAPLDRLDDMVAMVRDLHMPPPVTLNAPGKHDPLWMAQSDTGNRPLRVSYKIDPQMMMVVDQERFRDKKAVDQIVGFGIAAHEGQLFGPLNQALGVLAAAGLMTLCVSAVVMWWQRRPDGRLGAPARLPDQRLGLGLGVLILALAVFLPVLGICLIVVGVVERLVLRRIRPVAQWLGLDATG